MELTKDEKAKLEQYKKVFKMDKLTKDQIELIIDRKISTDNIYSLKNLFYEKKPKSKPKFELKEVFKHAAKKAQRRINRKQEDYKISKLFITNNYKIVKEREYTYNKFNTIRSEWKIYGDIDIFQTQQVINNLVIRMTEGLPDNVKLQIMLVNNKDDRSIQTKLINKDEMIIKLSDWVNFFIDYKEMEIEDLTFVLLSIEIPSGAGRVNTIITVDSKRSILRINNNDTLCLARAIIVGLAVNNKEKLESIFKDKLSTDEVKLLNKSRKNNKTEIHNGKISANELEYIKKGRNIQKVLADILHRLSDIKVTNNGNNFEDVKHFEEYLDIEIQVYNFESRQIYKGHEKPIKIAILLSENHYDVISNINGFLCKNASHHNVENERCKQCNAPSKCVPEKNTICNECNKYFYSQKCHENHKNNKRCIEYSYKCKDCERFYLTKELPMNEHKCDEHKCGNCKLYVTDNHQCYMLKKDIQNYSTKYIFFDFETKLDKNDKHIVNFCVAQDFEGNEFCFENINDFCNWAFKHRGYTFIAHYGKGYDFQFVAEWLISHSVKPKIINNGQKILQLEVGGGYSIRFIDSISFTMTALRNFPKTFGLKELAKGYFPHKFNTDENQNYIGTYPDKKYYGYEEMTKKDRKEFDTWYETVKDKEFNFRKEMYEYCKSDVDILRRGCLKLRELFIKISGIDPFRYITIASVCMAIYRSQYLPENTIGIYTEIPTDNYSIKAIKWLEYIMMNNNINIKHACNGGETVIKINGKSLKVDGYCKETNTIYQFHGCYFHGCLKCYNELTINTLSRYNMKYLNSRTQKIENLLKSKYNVITIWEHEFNNEMKKVKIDDLLEPPKIRESFYGGRCEPTKLIYNFKSKNVKGKYIDVVSLYPTVMYYDKYPVGHPKKVLKPKEYNKEWFGFIYCKVIPPKGLYLPVLPYKQKTKNAHKLLFGLCRTCMNRINLKCTHFNTTKHNIECTKGCNIKRCPQCQLTRKRAKENCQQCYIERNSDCTHSDSERAITGFWTTPEMEKALEKGYKIEKIYEVWNFENYSTELFKEYIKKFLKIKLETSKFTCSEEEYRQKARKFGIELEELKENPGMRFISKICLNSLWGKFGQNQKVRHSEYIDTEKDFYKVVLNDKIENLALMFLNENIVYTSYETKDEFLKDNYNTNIYIASFTTSWARLRLYNMLEKLDKNVCYCDTDSIVYIENVNIDQDIGDSLGEWTDELDQQHMIYWCCAQAKDYGYILDNKKSAGKVKGFRRTGEAEEKMTNEQRINLIKGAVDHIDVNYNRFDIKYCKIATKHMVKQWAFKFDKRMVRKISEDEIDTFPYGY